MRDTAFLDPTFPRIVIYAETMAQIVNFPSSLAEQSQARRTSHTTHSLPTIPAEFSAQLDAVRSMQFLQSVTYSEIPAPRCVGDFGFGVELAISDEKSSMDMSENANHSNVLKPMYQASDVTISAENLAGWVLVNYSNMYREDWGSHWRCTGFFRQPLVSEDESSLVTQMYWDYAYDVLTPLAVGSVNGAATKAESEFFDSISSRELSTPITSCEMRASWSPQCFAESGASAATQINAWAELMLRAAGRCVMKRSNS